MRQVNEKEFNELCSTGLVLVDFFATWCGPCKMIAPVLEELSKEIDDVTFVKIDVDQDSAVAQKYQVMSIPTLFLLKDGEVVNKTMGFKPKEELVAFINKGR